MELRVCSGSYRTASQHGHFIFYFSFWKHHLSGFHVLLWKGSKQDPHVYENKVAEKLVFAASDH